MFELFLGLIIGLITGSIGGYILHPALSPSLPSIIYPTQIGQSGVYTIKMDGRFIYDGNDLQEAKRIYKQDYPKGHVLEFFNNGNHVVSRETKNGPISSRS